MSANWREIAGSLAARLRDHATCLWHPAEHPDDNCRHCADRAAYTVYITATGQADARRGRMVTVGDVKLRITVGTELEVIRPHDCPVRPPAAIRRVTGMAGNTVYYREVYAGTNSLFVLPARDPAALRIIDIDTFEITSQPLRATGPVTQVTRMRFRSEAGW